MAISATDPIGPALNRTGRMLFKPFNIGKWFVLGFAAFLAMLGEGGAGQVNNLRGGGGGRVRVPAPGGGGNEEIHSAAELFDYVKQVFLNHAHWIIPVAFLVMLLWVLIVWLRAHGKFIFLDGVIRNHAAIVEPWSRLDAVANSYFRFDLLTAALFLLGTAVIGAVGYAIALPDLRASAMGTAGITAIVVAGLLLVMLVFAYGIVHALAEDFVMPLMYARPQSIRPAWSEFRERVLRGHVGVITLFYLMRIVIGLASASMMFVGMCVTCCIAGLPYLSSVVFLPIFVFVRSYALYFLAQFGADYNLMMEIALPMHSAFQVVFPNPMPPPPLPPQDGPP